MAKVQASWALRCSGVVGKGGWEPRDMGFNPRAIMAKSPPSLGFLICKRVRLSQATSLSLQFTQHTNTSVPMSLSRCYPLREAQNPALHKLPGKCLPGPHSHTLHGLWWPRRGHLGVTKGGALRAPSAIPGVARLDPLIALHCPPVPKVTFPAPSSDSHLNSSF